MKIKGIEKIGKLPESGFTGLEDVQDNRLRGYERKGGLRQVAPGSSSILIEIDRFRTILVQSKDNIDEILHIA